MKNIVSIKNLVLFYKKYPNAKTSIETWVSIAKDANWKKPSDVKNDFSDAKPVKITGLYLKYQITDTDWLHKFLIKSNGFLSGLLEHMLNTISLM